MGGFAATPEQLAGQGQSGTPAPSSSSPAQLAGMSASTSSTSGDSGQAMVMRRVYAIESELNSLAKEFPVASGACSKAVESVRGVLRQIIANPVGPEPVAPNIGG